MAKKKRLRGGGPIKLDPQRPYGLVSYSTFGAFGPIAALNRAYRKKSDLEEMLDYRTRLAEVLLKKSLLQTSKSRGGGEDPMEDLLSETEEEDKDDITTENLKKEFKIGINKIKIEYEVLVEGSIETDLETAVREFLLEDVPDEDHREILIESSLINVVIWKDSNIFFVFDPKPRDETGHVYGADEWSEKIVEVEMEEEEEEEEEEEIEGGGEVGYNEEGDVTLQLGEA